MITKSKSGQVMRDIKNIPARSTPQNKKILNKYKFNCKLQEKY